MNRIIVLLPLVALTACASRLSDYPGHFDDTTRGVEVDGRKFVVQHHETEQMLMVSPTLLAAAGAGMAIGLTLADGHDVAGARSSTIAKAGLAYLANDNCKITDVEAFGRVSYELTYQCEELEDG